MSEFESEYEHKWNGYDCCRVIELLAAALDLTTIMSATISISIG